MPKVDFSTVEDAKSFTPVPAGSYAVDVDSIEGTYTSGGDEMWKMRLKVLDGPHAGRFLFDNLVFSQRAMKRVKLICSKLGLETSGEVDLTPRMLRGKTCRVTVEVEDFVDDEGREKQRNNIPYAGYEAINDAAGSGGDDEDDPL
jgi:hypothetical protein